MSKVEELSTDDGTRRLMFECPGCEMAHQVYVTGPTTWAWNGSYEKPTFTPSILVTGVKPLTEEQYATYLETQVLPEPEPLRCHSFVTDGRIQFLSDCTHKLANSTVDLPDCE